MGINLHNTIRPRDTQFEFSLFGRGTAYGESIVLHLGDNKWGIIDSCINPRTNIPIALEYLKALSVPYKNVEFIVCTHWHQDHITGFTSLVEQCEEADIFLSAAMNSEEYNRMIGYQAKALSMFNSAKEYIKLFSYMDVSKRRPKRVIQDKVLHRTKIGDRDLILTALSPNDSTISHFEETIRKQLEKLVAKEEGLYKILKPEPNFQSIVILLTIGDFSLLLGADLEVTTKPNMGWTGILESKVITTSEIFKVPHHGSENGYDERIWMQLLKEEPYLVLTPMKKGRNTLLPTKEMISTFCNYSPHSYITSNPHVSPTKHDQRVRKFIKKTKEKISKPKYDDYGHIRLRKEFSADESEITCELFGTALALNELKEN